MKKKRILAMFLAVASCLSLAVGASAANTTTRKATDFKDYDAKAWYAEAVSAAVDNGLLYGKSATVIDPNGDMTRAEMAAIINRSFGCYKTADISQYKDVSKDKWYYHPHEELHHIKKENIGLIEVMGLAILPGRLKKEMADLKEALLNGEDLRASETLAKHADWAEEFMGRHPEFNADNAEEIIKDEIGQVFAKVLECAGVYKCTAEGREHLKKFLTEVQNG